MEHGASITNYLYSISGTVIVKGRKNMEERVNALCTAFHLLFQSLASLIQHANADLTQDDKLDKVT